MVSWMRVPALAAAALMAAGCHDPVGCGPSGGGCGPGAPAPAVAEPPPPPVIAETAGPARPGPDELQAAERFVRDLDGRTSDGSLAVLSRDQAPQVFTEAVVGLIAAARAWTGEGPHPALKADPLCLCQDPDGLVLRSVRVEVAGPDGARAWARFAFADHDETQETVLDLRRDGEAWRVEDIRTEAGFSFRQALDAGS